jgi:hypothetical protein
VYWDNGGGVYPGGHGNTYLPLLRQLRFMAGRVDHTFIEGKK